MTAEGRRGICVDGDADPQAVARWLRVVCRSASLKAAQVRGNTIISRCLVNSDTTPSLCIYVASLPDGTAKWVYKCHSCGARGSLADLVAKDAGIDKAQARKMLESHLASASREIGSPAAQGSTSADPVVLELVADYCYHVAWDDNKLYRTAAKAQRAYLEGRAEMRQVRRLRMGVGLYGQPRKNDLPRFLESKKRSDLLEDAEKVLSRIAGSIVIPVRDRSGHTIALCSRRVDGKANRYANLGPTGGVLLGLDTAKGAIVLHQCAVLVEGVFDMATLRELGAQCMTRVLDNGKDGVGPLDNTVAIMGARPTKRQLAELKCYTDRIIVVRDGDKADDLDGASAIIADAADAGLEARVVVVPDNRDPDEYVKFLGSTGMGPIDVLQAFRADVLNAKNAVTTGNLTQSASSIARGTSTRGELHVVYGQDNKLPHFRVGRTELAEVLAKCDASEVLVWLVLKAEVAKQRTGDGRLAVTGNSVARNCGCQWRHVRRIMENLKAMGFIDWDRLSEKTPSHITVTPLAKTDYMKVPMDFVWKGHARKTGTALPTLLALKSAVMPSRPATTASIERIAGRVGRSPRAVSDEVKRLTKMGHLMRCETNGRKLIFTSLMPVI